jgi:hypothetical protein
MSSSMMICPLMRGCCCAVPLCAILMTPSPARHGYPVAISTPAWPETAWTRNVNLDDKPDFQFQQYAWMPN